MNKSQITFSKIHKGGGVRYPVSSLVFTIGVPRFVDVHRTGLTRWHWLSKTNDEWCPAEYKEIYSTVTTISRSLAALSQNEACHTSGHLPHYFPHIPNTSERLSHLLKERSNHSSWQSLKNSLLNVSLKTADTVMNKAKNSPELGHSHQNCLGQQHRWLSTHFHVSH